jgi:hypothetical protein
VSHWRPAFLPSFLPSFLHSFVPSFFLGAGDGTQGLMCTIELYHHSLMTYLTFLTAYGSYGLELPTAPSRSAPKISLANQSNLSS